MTVRPFSSTPVNEVGVTWVMVIRAALSAPFFAAMPGAGGPQHLTRLMGRHEAHQLLYEAAQRCRSDGVPFATAISEHPLLAAHDFAQDLAMALDPQGAAVCLFEGDFDD